MKTKYYEKTIELFDCEKDIAEQFNGGKLPLEFDETKLDGLGYDFCNDKGVNCCEECGVELSDKEASIYAKYSKSDKTMCIDCHSNHTINMNEDEMAQLLCEYHNWVCGDTKWTLANQFKRRDDLAFMLMATCPKESYNMDGEY
tara:strand:+ start:573 stop:1004 length:432 start_codon:yes stop_codon:yes gene_type:complete